MRNIKFNIPTQLDQNVNSIENAKEQTSCSNHIVKPTAKAKKAKNVITLLFEK